MTDSPRASLRSTASTNSSEPLYQVKLLAALRSGDPALIHPFLAEIGRTERAGENGEGANGPLSLHLAVRCASIDTLALVLSQRAISPNSVYPTGSGTTPLHLAASLGRADAVKILLEQSEIDDTLKDAQGRTCLDVSRSKSVTKIILDSRAFLDASYRSLLHSYILAAPSSSPPTVLLVLLSSPRIRLVDLSYLDESSGSPLLHEAARKKDLQMIEVAVRAGADVFARDRRGKSVLDAAGKNDKTKAFLRQFSNKDTTLLDEANDEAGPPPPLRGYLNKYTNVARGYHTRWLVLKDGVLSYYRHQEDETVTSRGSIAVRTAVLKVAPGGDKLRFEVHSTPSKGHSNVQKWYMKANHPVEASRWTSALTKSIDWYKRSDHLRRPSLESQASGTLSIAPTRSSLSSTLGRSPLIPSASYFMLGAGMGVTDDEDNASGVEDSAPPPNASLLRVPGNAATDDEDGDADADATSTRSGGEAPHEANLPLHAGVASAQLELAQGLLARLPPSAEGAASRDALGALQGMLIEYSDMVRERETWFRNQLRHERARQGVWEESLRAVVQEGEAMENQLRSRTRRRSRAPEEGARNSTIRGPPHKILPRSPEEDEVLTPKVAVTNLDGLPTYFDQAVLGSTVVAEGKMPQSSGALSPRSGATTPNASKRLSMRFPLPFDEEGADTDEEDEFFDAIDAGALPNLEVAKPLLEHEVRVPEDQRAMYQGYERLRERLAITSDDRPPMSLWAVLKGSIGKDLTKISFPVFFNEPTSMLQRMAEDMEFSECLDAAAVETDRYRRLAFVAAYAMSNYSSTIGRIAKPFNPMLSETFEYVRMDKEYRYMSEQVSHHPPISACWAESPLWRYYGEVDAQNKFMGKSFEIRPTGIAHAELHLPAEKYPSYPKAKGLPSSKGKVAEHYSWKKVTTNVSGFILGQPTIDHYGDMIVTNHRTGDQCILTFKPRGWRGKDAFEISGEVIDASGAVRLELAGRWNTQLVARTVGSGKGSLNPDVSVDGSAVAPEYVLLWRNSQKPAAPFNLTPFAITLNDCPDTLRPFLCPTDCRLRPDQRSFENGNYEHANLLKNAQEERQRAIRRGREEGQIPPHRPRWFAAETDGDTGERVWAPSLIGGELEYWRERSRVWAAGGVSKQQWENVDSIFVDNEGH